MPKLEAFGLGDGYATLLGSDCTGFIKPEAEASRQLLCDGQSPNNSLFVDKQRHNVEAARCLGCHTVFANPKRSRLEEIDALVRSDFDDRTAAGRRQLTVPAP